MFEPRGHDMMSGSLIYPPEHDENDAGILFIETSGCLPMCGHGTIGTLTVAIQEGLIRPQIPGQVRLETPAGLVKATYEMDGDRVSSVTLVNVPSFLAAADLEVESPQLGTLRFDVAYGGNFYAIIDPQPSFSGIESYSAAQLVHLSQELRPLINEKYPDLFVHPEHDKIRSVTHLMWTGKPLDTASSGRNAVFYGDKAIDRSPCGTGTSARMAQWYERNLLRTGDLFIHESYIGSVFTGKIKEEYILAGKKAIIPSIKGWARITGFNTIIIDDDDPFAEGFQVI